jgi:hypothetical protein
MFLSRTLTTTRIINFFSTKIPLINLDSQTINTMQFTTAATALMLSSVCSAAVLPRNDSSSKPAESQKFITHSKPKGAENFDNSLGYLFAEYAYGGGYYATLHTDKSDAIAGSISDSALSFGDEYPQGFKLYELSEQYPSSIAQIFSGQAGTPGMAVEDGLLVWNSPDNVPVSWFGRFSRCCVARSCELTANSLPELGSGVGTRHCALLQVGQRHHYRGLHRCRPRGRVRLDAHWLRSLLSRVCLSWDDHTNQHCWQAMMTMIYIDDRL